MSYSRFSNSVWYTYHLATDKHQKNEQVFRVFDIADFKYPELKKSVEKCLERIAKIELPGGGLPTERQLQELGRYMKKFLDEIEEDYRKE